MRIAIPLADGQLTPHFGHCPQMALVDVDPERQAIIAETVVPTPAHVPGLLPTWLREREVNLVIAGGMGQRALQLFAAAGIEVVIGAPVDAPRALVEAYLAGRLQTGANVCDH